MKLTYWVAVCETDSKVYSIRERTKKAAMARAIDYRDTNDYGPITKVTVEYQDALDLVQKCLCEGGGYWEST